jgi:hypothetical protein
VFPDRMEREVDHHEPGVVKASIDLLGRAVEAYQRSPVLRVLVKLNPALGAVEAALLSTWAYFQHRRMEVFADELTTLGLNVTEDDARQREFFDAFTSTVRHTAAETRDEKIRLFARLFANHVARSYSTPIDLYEEYLSVLDELSEREFSILLILRKYEIANPIRANENALQRAQRFWGAFAREAQEGLGIPANHLEPLLDRLTRTGLYQTIVGAFIDYTGGRGHLTPYFDGFLDALGLLNESEIS